MKENYNKKYNINVKRYKNLIYLLYKIFFINIKISILIMYFYNMEYESLIKLDYEILKIYKKYSEKIE